MITLATVDSGKSGSVEIQIEERAFSEVVVSGKSSEKNRVGTKQRKLIDDYFCDYQRQMDNKWLIRYVAQRLITDLG